jgi:hypothetical protein
VARVLSRLLATLATSRTVRWTGPARRPMCRCYRARAGKLRAATGIHVDVNELSFDLSKGH